MPLGVQWHAALRWSAEALPKVRNPEPVVLDVFISYANADWKIARALASDLENRGRTVWWDGYPYQDYTERSLAARDAARVVIVIWSADACKSADVRDDAKSAREAGKLISTYTSASDIPEYGAGWPTISVFVRHELYREIAIVLGEIHPKRRAHAKLSPECA